MPGRELWPQILLPLAFAPAPSFTQPGTTMSDQFHEFDTDADQTPTRPGQLSANGHWIFGSIYAVLALVGFSFGVWAGASKPRPVEVAEAKQKENASKPPDVPAKAPVTPPNANPNPNPPAGDPKPMDPKPTDPKSKDPEPDPKPVAKPDNGLASIGGALKTESGTPVTPVVVGKAVSFKTEVMPVLQKYCVSCHGALAGKQKGNLDLRSIAAIMKGGENGDVLKVGDPKKSTLYTLMLEGADTPMPPEGKPQPTEAEKKIIADWIASGAKPRRTVVRRRADHRKRGFRARLELTSGWDAG